MKTLLIVLLVILAAGVLLSRLRLGGKVTYSAAGVAVSVRVGALSFQVFPGKEKTQKEETKETSKAKKEEKKTKKKKPRQAAKKNKPSGSARSAEKNKKDKPKESPAPEQEHPAGGRLDLLMEAIPKAFELLGDVVRRLRVDELFLDYTIAGRHDAAGAAIQYGAVCATGGAVYGLLLQHLAIRKQSIQARVDFQAEEPLVYLRLGLSYTLGQLVVIAVIALRKLLPLWKKWNQMQKKDK